MARPTEGDFKDMSHRLNAPDQSCLLPLCPRIGMDFRAAVQRDYERMARSGLPENLDEYLLDAFGMDMSATYGKLPVRNPWGKASGQLSMTAGQVREDIEAGLGFVVLKTVIAQDEAGGQSMSPWAIRESRMDVERITSAAGESGWTVTWKGRGWWQSFDDYLRLIRTSRELAADRGTLIIPSCKYHLPPPGESQWRTAEYAWTTDRLLDAWRLQTTDPVESMPLEKDFSPTLAGSDLATARPGILHWLQSVPALMRSAGMQTGSRPLHVGLKLFNALFDDSFQLDMLNTIHQLPSDRRPDFFIYGNRLFNPDRVFEGQQGVACGGPDLSDRNLRVMSAFARGCPETEPDPATQALPWSATGNIVTGKLAMEYALRGATSFQLHTFFQLPADQYSMKSGSRTSRALHELYFHPETGLLVWQEHIRQQLGIARPVRFLDVVSRAMTAFRNPAHDR